jgi:hypothetical protein
VAQHTDEELLRMAEQASVIDPDAEVEAES